MAAIAGMIGGGILSGIGQSVSAYYTAKQQQQFLLQMQQMKGNQQINAQNNMYQWLSEMQADRQEFSQHMLAYKAQLNGMNTPAALMATSARISSSDGLSGNPNPSGSRFNQTFESGGILNPGTPDYGMASMLGSSRNNGAQTGADFAPSTVVPTHEMATDTASIRSGVDLPLSGPVSSRVADVVDQNTEPTAHYESARSSFSPSIASAASSERPSSRNSNLGMMTFYNNDSDTASATSA